MFIDFDGTLIEEAFINGKIFMTKTIIDPITKITIEECARQTHAGKR